METFPENRIALSGSNGELDTVEQTSEGAQLLIDRRTMIGATAAAAASMQVNSSPVFAAVSKSGGGAAHQQALKKLAGFAEQYRANWGLPGMTICLVDRDGFSGFVRSGLADIGNKVPVEPEHLFQIGSISKMMAALTLWSMFEDGKLSLDTRLVDALKGIKVRDGEDIRLHHLLDHTSGMPNIAPYFSEVGLWSSYTPGSHWNYCNIGYGMLGLIIAHADGRSFAEAVEARVFKPLGMNASVGSIRGFERSRYPVGYLPYYTDRIALRPSPVAPATWSDIDNAAGCIASTAGDMAKFMRFLIGLTEGKGSGVICDANAVKFLANPADAPANGKDVTYGNGVGHYPIDGRTYLHHTGGMVSFVSSIHVDVEAGVAAFASTNIGYASRFRPRDVTIAACNLLRAVNSGEAAEAPKGLKPTVEKPEQYVGRFTAADGDSFEIIAGGDTITLRKDGADSRMQSVADPLFACEAPEFQVTGLLFEIEDNAAVRVWSGEKEYLANPSAGYKPEASAELKVLTGRYEGTFPTIIYARDGALWVNNREKLEPLPNGDYRVGPEWSPERVRFDGYLNGRPNRMLASGNPYWRGFS